ncbi:MAG: 3-deoxy-8-phosphooctulonate synthase [Mariprofundales bacterium]
MKQARVEIADITVGNDLPLVLMAGPCVIEGEQFTLDVAGQLAEICNCCGIRLIFKSSFDKANRTSSNGFRGPGMEKGLAILARVKREIGVAVMTDVHTAEQALPVAQVVDLLQTPAFLCRQTDFIAAVASTGKPVSIKKGQFLAPWDMQFVLEKAYGTGNKQIMLCERGASFGYNNLVSDMRSLLVMRDFGAPVVFDATHSVQQPGGLGGATGGKREFVPGLSRAAVATGIAALFMEVHPDPDHAKSDGPNSLALNDVERLISQVQDIDNVVK